MLSGTYSDDELRKFIDEIVLDSLAVNVYYQLLEDGGNTALGISENLQAKGIKASKTRVYEEISRLVKIGLIKRVSNRPPVYTTVQSRENFEKMAMKFFMDTREELLRKWAATYPFLPDELKSTDKQAIKLSTGPIVNFNPYPIVNTFPTDKDGMRRYMLRVFEAHEVMVSMNMLDVGFSSSSFRTVFEDEKFQPLIQQFQMNVELYGRLKIRSLSTIQTEDIIQLKNLKKLTPFYKQFFKLVDYEVREMKTALSSFIVADNYLLYPMGIAGTLNKVFAYIEVRDPDIIENAKFAYEKAWEKGKPYLKIENGAKVEN
ncbi:MAG: TrmB family transcriptional regulator [Asgard group archaeon]|nr:TrmB family transcriptional regulator [Asgard group archaeon]